MTGAPNKQLMMNAFRRTQADIARLTDWIECELEKCQDDEVTWESANSLKGVRENLIETLALFSGVDRRAIQRNLDELRM